MRRFLIPFVLLLAAGSAFADQAAQPKSLADQRADRLDELFAQLHQAKTGDAAQAPEHDIWALWMSSDSPTADALLGQATRAMNDGDPTASRHILDRLTQIFPNYAEVWNKRATLNFMQGRFDESLADIDRVLALEPRHFGALSGKGLVLERQKKYPQALAAFHEALDINPNMSSIQDEIKKIEKLARDI